MSHTFSNEYMTLFTRIFDLYKVSFEHSQIIYLCYYELKSSPSHNTKYRRAVYDNTIQSSSRRAIAYMI